MRLGPDKTPFDGRTSERLGWRLRPPPSHRRSSRPPLSVVGLGVLSLTLERLLKARFVLVNRYRILRYTARQRFKSRDR